MNQNVFCQTVDLSGTTSDMCFTILKAGTYIGIGVIYYMALIQYATGSWI